MFSVRNSLRHQYKVFGLRKKYLYGQFFEEKHAETQKSLERSVTVDGYKSAPFFHYFSFIWGRRRWSNDYSSNRRFVERRMIFRRMDC
jgi:hypothetical protein